MAIGVIDRLRKLKSPAAVLVGILFLVEPFSAAAGTLANQLRATVDKVVTILQDARLKPAAQKTKCRGQLRQVIEPQFDFQEMAKRSLGPHWHGHNREQQTTFVTLFTDLLAESYVYELETHAGEQFIYLRETEDAGFSEVAGKIVDKKGEKVGIKYKLLSANGNWKIYDLLIDNVSIVNSYRSLFNRILTNASFEELLKHLQQKRVKELRPERLGFDRVISYSIMSAAASAPRLH